MTKRTILLLLFGGSLLFNVLGNQLLPVTDPVESNYALTAKEMVESGDWLSPQIYGHVWFDKPVMIYWLVAASFKLFGVGAFAARFPSAVCAAATVALAYWFSLQLYRSRIGALTAALALATSLQFWIVSRGIITDAALMLFASLTLVAFQRWWSEQRQIWLDLAFAASGLAVLTKGPVGLVLPGLVILAFSAFGGRWGWLRPTALLRGFGCFLLVTAPWYIAMYLLHGDSFVKTFLGLHNYVRATVSEHEQDNVWYYYLLVVPLSLLPWTGVFLRSLSRLRHEWAGQGRFLWLWFAIIVLFYSLMATKYATYAFTALFPAAVLIGRRVEEMAHAWSGRREWLWITLPLGLQALVFAAAASRLPVREPSLLYGILAACLMLLVWQQTRGKRSWFVATSVMASAAMTLAVLFSLIVPLVEGRSANDVAVLLPPPTEDAAVACYGDYATSAVFYSGRTVKRLDDSVVARNDIWAGKYTMPTQKTADFLAEARPSYLLVKEKSMKEFEQMPYRNLFREVARGSDLRLFVRK